MTKRPCLDCGHPAQGTRCPPCLKRHNAQRWQAKGGRYNGEWRKTAPAILEQHRARHGNVCPGWEREQHEATDLVVDHDAGPLCRSCNGVKAAKYDKQRARQGRGTPPARG